MSMKNILMFAIVLLVPFMLPSQVSARTDAMRQQCDVCHTMHNSQDSGTQFKGGGSSEALLNSACYGCHSNEIDPGTENAANTTPYVWQTDNVASYNSNTLAGGDFYWVSQDVPEHDPKGHNVEGIVSSQDTRTAPGGSPGGTEEFSATRPLTCAGKNGCHGNRLIENEIVAMSKAHHNDDGALMDGLTVATSYRFLLGVIGYEDPDWELTAVSGTTNHNQYNGAMRGDDTATATTATISNFCAGCHSDFHNIDSPRTGDGTADTSWGNPWIRHPVDFSMGALVGEYDNYGGAGVNDYLVTTPLASVNAVRTATVTGASESIIMCLSCHRAHGSPYDGILRWDYRNWPGSGYNGCGDCHTEKN